MKDYYGNWSASGVGNSMVVYSYLCRLGYTSHGADTGGTDIIIPSAGEIESNRACEMSWWLSGKTLESILYSKVNLWYASRESLHSFVRVDIFSRCAREFSFCKSFFHAAEQEFNTTACRYRFWYIHWRISSTRRTKIARARVVLASCTRGRAREPPEISER